MVASYTVVHTSVLMYLLLIQPKSADFSQYNGDRFRGKNTSVSVVVGVDSCVNIN